MNEAVFGSIVSFIWTIADDCLRDVYVRGKYRDVILPMTVLRRLDSVLEPTKKAVLEKKAFLDKAGVSNQDGALCNAARQNFFNASPFCLKDLAGRTNVQQLTADFAAYVEGFSPNVRDILDKFDFSRQIEKMVKAKILGSVIGKFVSSRVNFGPEPVLDEDGNVRLPALDNHTMGTIFEELIRRFNEENNEEAGEHFTPRDVIELMADIVVLPIADKLRHGTYTCYDGACGTGGMLTVAEQRLKDLAESAGKKVSIHLFGQEVNPETCAITKADMILKGEGAQTHAVVCGSTLADDGYTGHHFDIMLSNPPYGKAWGGDADKMGGKAGITDLRFQGDLDGEPLSMIPRSSDGQMLFLLNNISKMREVKDNGIGSRIAEVHNGSSLFTGGAGSGESNTRRFIIENDMLDAIIALPENMFYNTGIATFIWVVSNNKAEHRRGKVQLIDATKLFVPLRKNLGQKNCEFSAEIRRRILDIYTNFEESGESKIFDNADFGYWEIAICRPELDADGKPVLDKKNKPKPDKSKNDTEQVPFKYKGGSKAFFEKEVKPFAPDAWIDKTKTRIGYEISFTKYFYKPTELRSMDVIKADLRALEKETEGLINEILGE